MNRGDADWGAMPKDTAILYAAGVSLIFVALLLAYLIHRNTPL